MEDKPEVDSNVTALSKRRAVEAVEAADGGGSGSGSGGSGSGGSGSPSGIRTPWIRFIRMGISSYPSLRPGYDSICRYIQVYGSM